MDKLSHDTDVHGLSAAISAKLGFDHIIDALGEKLATGEIRPEQLNKVSVADAVKMTHASNEAAAKKMADAKKAALEGMTIHKEYPEGWKWAKLDKPGQFAAESDEMGHSVRGYEPPKTRIVGYEDNEFGNDQAVGEPGVHPDWIPASGDSGSSDYGHGGWGAIKSGKAEVYSLKDPKGNSKATVEVGHNYEDVVNDIPEEQQMEILDQANNHPAVQDARENYGEDSDEAMEAEDRVREELSAEWAKDNKPATPRISQIKGPQNRKPSDDALPFIQDFVKSKEWSAVGDLENSGMTQEELRAHQATFSK
jgi:hypothetical protein